MINFPSPRPRDPVGAARPNAQTSRKMPVRRVSRARPAAPARRPGPPPRPAAPARRPGRIGTAAVASFAAPGFLAAPGSLASETTPPAYQGHPQVPHPPTRHLPAL
jgi:hypothetical protein